MKKRKWLLLSGAVLILIIFSIIYLNNSRSYDIKQATVQNKSKETFVIKEKEKLEEISLCLSKINWDPNKKVEMAAPENTILKVKYTNKKMIIPPLLEYGLITLKSSKL